jgi:hypothetical protein
METMKAELAKEGISPGVINAVMTLNDGEGQSFEAIADFLEEVLETGKINEGYLGTTGVDDYD